MNQINVVPYIDVMLVLLVIFMATAPLIQTGSIDLPSIGKSSQPPAAPLEVVIHADNSLALRNRAQGGIEQPVSQADLAARLKDAQAKNPLQPVLIAADKSVRYESVLNVMDQLQRNQVTKIGLLVQPGQQPGNVQPGK
jgi:biopolymer transport protein TolR